MSYSSDGPPTGFAPSFDLMRLTPDHLEAITQVMGMEHHTLVPLVEKNARADILQGGEGYLLEGVVAYATTYDVEPLEVDPIIVPPAGWHDKAFLELGRSMIAPIAGRVAFRMEAIFPIVGTDVKIATGIGKYINADNPDRSFMALWTPNAYRYAAPPGLASRDEGPELFAATFSAALFALLSSSHLRELHEPGSGGDQN